MANLLFVTTSYPSSPEDGVCGFVDDLAQLLVRHHGHSVRVVTPPHSGGAPAEAFAPVSLERVRHAWIGSRALDAGADCGAAVARSWRARVEAASLGVGFVDAVRRARHWSDAVISHWMVPAGLSAAVARARAHVAVAHGGDVHLLGRIPAGARLARFVTRRADRIVCVSRDLERRLVAMAPDASPKIHVAAMGANLGEPADPGEVRALRELHGATDRPIVLFLGRLQPIKGVDVLIDAVARAPGVDVWIAGDGPEHECLLERARAARLRVSFLGRIDRRTRRAALEASDAVVIPSRIEPGGRMEGTPVVCAESMASGRPVIATRTGGLASAVDDGVTGVLVDPDDSAALAGVLRRFASDAAWRRHLADGARTAAPRFEMTATASAFDRIVGEAIAAAGGKPRA